MAVLLVQQIAANFMTLLPTCVSTLVLLDQLILLTLHVVSTLIYKTPIDYSMYFSKILALIHLAKIKERVSLIQG